MSFRSRVQYDYECLFQYFRTLFNLVGDPAVFNDIPVDHSDEIIFEEDHPYSFGYLVRPDMTSNIYSFLEFWQKELCKYAKNTRKLKLGCNDLSSDNDLKKHHKYFRDYVGVDIDSAGLYKRLDELRKVRNIHIHHGGHIPAGSENKFQDIKNVKIEGSILMIEDEFVWSTLEAAKNYLTDICDKLNDK